MKKNNLKEKIYLPCPFFSCSFLSQFFMNSSDNDDHVLRESHSFSYVLHITLNCGGGVESSATRKN